MLTREDREYWIEEIKFIEHQLKYSWQSAYGDEKSKCISFPYEELGDDIVFTKCQYGFCENIEVEEIKLSDCDNNRITQHKKAIEVFKERGWKFSERHPFNVCPICAKARYE